uniref:Uncharacterized protein n=1 Tax=Lepeophtheirus salmonis TaxID=72036 RepID=A0A0K2V162_LEPSM
MSRKCETETEQTIQGGGKRPTPFRSQSMISSTTVKS